MSRVRAYLSVAISRYIKVPMKSETCWELLLDGCLEDAELVSRLLPTTQYSMGMEAPPPQQPPLSGRCTCPSSHQCLSIISEQGEERSCFEFMTVVRNHCSMGAFMSITRWASVALLYSGILWWFSRKTYLSCKDDVRALCFMLKWLIFVELLTNPFLFTFPKPRRCLNKGNWEGIFLRNWRILITIIIIIQIPTMAFFQPNSVLMSSFTKKCSGSM